MTTIAERIAELRQRAQQHRTCAQHADNRASFREDMEAARKLDDEADELEAQHRDAQS